ncbi:MAG: gas vesicle protein GvpG [Candidatus Binataceae bacterium]
MFLIDDLLMAPGSFLLWVMRKVQEAAQEELENDTARITAELSELHRELETGAITEAQFDAREKELLDRLDRIREQNDDFESAEGKHDDED